MKKPKSKKPKKQRKWRSDAPLHRKQKLVASTLSRGLREKYNRRRVAIRKGDNVKVMRGEFKGNGGEVTRISLKSSKVYVDGITIKKADGTDVEKALDPSNLMITELYMDDKERRNMLERTLEKK